MDRLTVRLPTDLIRRFDAAAAGLGGRSRLLRRLIEGAAQAALPELAAPSMDRLDAKLSLRLTSDDMALLELEAARTCLSRTQWTVALIRRRLHERPQLSPSEAIAFIGIQRELRRIGVNVNQIARAMNTAVLEGKVLDLEVAQLADFAVEIRAHLGGVHDAFKGTDPFRMHDASRAFAGQMFGDSHPYVFAFHTDQRHPHVHLTVRTLGHDGHKLNPRKADLEQWRQTEYSNLVYACRFCNVCKSNHWVGEDPLTPNDGERGFVDPCSADYEVHLERDDRGRITARSPLGVYIIRRLKLNLVRHELLWNARRLRNLRDQADELIVRYEASGRPDSAELTDLLRKFRDLTNMIKTYEMGAVNA